MNEGRWPDPSRRLVLDGTRGAVRHSRDFTRRALTEWGRLDDGVEAEDVLLLVSEVVANARLHGGGPNSLVLRCTDERLRVEVTDNSPVAPRPRPWPDPARPGGHGLLIVQRLARRWGSQPVAGGKCVWFEIDPPPRTSPHGPHRWWRGR